MSIELFEQDGDEKGLELIRVVGGVEHPIELVGAATVDPPPDPTPTPGIVGIYYESATSADSNTLAAFGTYPPIASWYHVGSNTINMSFHSARIGRGTRPLLAFSTRNNPTITLTDIANDTGPARTWMDDKIEDLHELSQIDTGIPVYAALESEFEVKVNQGVITGISTAIYAAALDVWHARLHAGAPDVHSTYWFGGADWAKITQVVSGMSVAPRLMAFDPYRNPGDSSAMTFAEKAGPKLATLKAIPNYTMLGSPPVACAETGTDRGHGDTSVANYINSIPVGLASLGLQFCLWFNRDSGPTNNCKLDGHGFTASVAALSALMAAGVPDA